MTILSIIEGVAIYSPVSGEEQVVLPAQKPITDVLLSEDVLRWEDEGGAIATPRVTTAAPSNPSISA